MVKKATAAVAADAPEKRKRGRPRKHPIQPPKPPAPPRRKITRRDKELFEEDLNAIYKELFGSEGDWSYREIIPNNVIFNELLDRWLFTGRTRQQLYELTGMSRQRFHEYSKSKRSCPMHIWLWMMRELECEVVFRANGIVVRKQKAKEGDFDYNIRTKTLDEIL